MLVMLDLSLKPCFVIAVTEYVLLVAVFFAELGIETLPEKVAPDFAAIDTVFDDSVSVRIVQVYSLLLYV